MGADFSGKIRRSRLLLKPHNQKRIQLVRLLNSRVRNPHRPDKGVEVSAEKIYLLSRPDNRAVDGGVSEMRTLIPQGADFMNMYRKIAKGAVFGLMLAALAMGMQAQDNKPPETKKGRETRRRSSSASSANTRLRRANSTRLRHSRTLPSRSIAAKRRRQSAQHAPLSGRPAQVREPQSASPGGDAPGDTCLPRVAAGRRRAAAPKHRAHVRRQPAAQPGRTFGNNPRGRDAEPAARTGSQMGARPMAPASRIVYHTRRRRHPPGYERASAAGPHE